MIKNMERHFSEWLVFTDGSIDLCVGVRDGVVDEVRINGLRDHASVSLNMHQMQSLARVLNEADRPVAAAIDRTATAIRSLTPEVRDTRYGGS